MLITKKGPFGKENTRDIPCTEEQYARYLSGNGLIQDIMPDVSKEDREFLISGTTPEEWAKLFPPGSDE